MRELLREREFVAYFLARQSSGLAYSIETVAIGWQVFGLRHRPFDLGLVGLLLFIPAVVLAVPAGIAADRIDRRVLCAICSVVEAACELSFIALVVSGSRTVGLYFGAVALIGAAHAFGSPAQRVLLASIVRSQHFVRAQAIASTFMQLIAVAGPALGGALVAVNVPSAFGAAALCYVVGAGAFAMLKSRGTELERAPEPREAIAGIRYIASHPVILGPISLDLFAVLFGGATALLPAYATQILHVGAVGYGLLRSAPAVGAMLVAAWIVRHPLSRRTGALLLGCVAGFGVATIIFGVSRELWLSLLMLALAGGFDMVSVVIRSTLVQLRTPTVMRGRVTAIENVFIDASNELGAFESGAAAALIGVVGSVVFGGAATLVVIAIWSALFPSLRRLDHITD